MGDISERVKELRKSRKWTQMDLCKKTGISGGMIGSIENGSRNPSKSTLSKIAKAFGVDANWLETGIETNTDSISSILRRMVRNGVIKSSNFDEDIKRIIIKAAEVEVDILLQESKK